ncbi:MAG: site-specific integrase [Bdellovibrionaceae bacterium]|nr:site-specific integrase [Pseudobdellovibrionaceae bacterium]
MRSNRKEVPVKNKTGVYKQFYWCEATSTWKPTGKYRSVRRVSVGETSQREQAFFSNIADALKFRQSGSGDERFDESSIGSVKEDGTNDLVFRDLVEQWKKYHFLLIEESTRQTYEKLLPTLDFLLDYPLRKIDNTVLNRLAHFWVNDYPRSWRRKSFEKEWQLLRVILQHYKDEIPDGASFVMPSFRKVKKMTELVPHVEGEVRFLDAEETVVFLSELRKRHRTFYHAALIQYFFALRVGEVCGLFKDCIDLKKKTIMIRRSVHWDVATWVPKIKEYTKTKRVRFLPIPDVLETELQCLLEAGDPQCSLLLARTDGSPLNRKTIATYYNKVLKDLGFTHVSGTHFLRKTAATLANEAVGDIDAVSRFLGHSSVRVTRRYTGETDSQKVKVSRALSSVFRVDGGAAQMFERSVDPQKPAIRLVK